MFFTFKFKRKRVILWLHSFASCYLWFCIYIYIYCDCYLSLNYSPGTYNLFKHNCNSFTNEVSNFLVGQDIPKYILDLPEEILQTYELLSVKFDTFFLFLLIFISY